MLDGKITIQKLLAGMARYNASDLHIKVGTPPTYRIDGVLRHVGAEKVTEDEADHLLDPIVPPALKEKFDRTGDLDFATHDETGDRFRISMFRSGGHTHAAIRRVKAEIPSYDELHLPEIYGKLVSNTPEGLVLVVGVTASGKSSTLAAMLEQINRTEACNIITIEDPVEYRFVPKKSVISQREVGIDTEGFREALRSVVRQDPDVILVGEMRDHDTVLAGIQAAETGHLVFATLHTADTMGAFNRMLEFFPQEEHAFVRSSLATTLRAILAQKLVPAVEGFEAGVVPAIEVLLVNAVVRERIREGGEEDFPAVIAGSRGEGMISFTESLAELVEKEWVDLRTALQFAPNQDALRSAVKGVQVKSSTLVHRVKPG